MYHIGAELGNGSVGVVHYGYKKGSDLNKQCAIKIMEKEDIEHDNYDTELEILKCIDHENIVNLYDLLHDEKRHY
jgi:serine/threonine protein kinase